MSETDPRLAATFEAHLRELARRSSSECGYHPTYFLQMLADRGGVGAAKALLASAKPGEGLTKLWEKRRLDLTVEAAVIQAPWSALFTADELATARKRLRDLGYRP